jgi:outer membrane usher protein
MLGTLGMFAFVLAAEAEPSADASLEFASEFLVTGGGQSVDLSRFEAGSMVPPGVHEVDVFVNQNRIGRAQVRFESRPEMADAEPVFDRDLLERIGVAVAKLSPEVVATLAAGQALPIDQAMDGATARFDFGELRLEMSVPQAAMNRNARGYVAPEHWDDGVAAAFVGYDASVYRNGGRTDEASRTQAYLGLSTGATLGDWRFRHQGAYQADSRTGGGYQGTATFAQRDLTTWKSRLTVGDAFTSGELFDSTGFRGLRIHSDDRMLPDSLRGYAPTVRGVANTNARVTIHQDGRLIHETVVAPGAFVIDDLYPTGHGGDLKVTVQEANGRTREFTVPYAAAPLSLRPGMNRFSVAAGQLRDARLRDDPLFAEATWQRGLNNLATGYGGLAVAPGYHSLLFGGVLNTSAGAIGLDVTQARTRLPGGDEYNGTSMRASYSKMISETGTNFSLAAYRYSTEGYFGLNEAMVMRERAGIEASLRPRNRAQLTFDQDLGEHRGQLYVTGSAMDYWGRGGSDLTYAAGYSNAIGRAGFNFLVTRQRAGAGAMDTTYHASLSIPLGSQRPAALSTGISHSPNGDDSVQTTLSGSLDDENALSYGLALNQTKDGHGRSQTSGSANAAYRGASAVYSTSIGMGPGFTQTAAGVRGAVVMHPGGVTLSQPISETFGVVEAKSATGVRVTNAAGVRVNARGYAIVPYMSPYVMNTVELDPKGLSTDVELQTTSQQVAPRAGAVPILRYATVTGRTLLIRGSREHGEPLPFGASVYDEEGKEIGIVGQASRLVARGLRDSGRLTVQWGVNANDTCIIDYALAERAMREKAEAYEQVVAPCVPRQPANPT